MYFVHPQIKLNIKNLKKVFFSFLKSPDEKVLEEVKSMFPEKEIIFTDMGRTAFRLIIEKMKLQNSQILFPAYICDIFFPIFKKYNLSPIFLDIDKATFNINLDQIESKITHEVKAILICHTYGLPVNLEKILALAKKYNLKVIEDCAHSFGAIWTGNFGDAAFFSLYKQFPTLRGGVAVLKNQKSKINPSTTLRVDGERSRTIKNQKSLLKTHFNFRDFLSLLNSFSFFAFLFKKFGGEIAPRIQRKEKFENLARINKVSLNLFFYFLKDFEKNLKNRVELALFFQEKLRELGFEVQKSEGNVFCYLSALVPKGLDRDKFVKELRKSKIFCTRIWKDPIVLNSEVQKEYNLNLEKFKNTLDVAKRVVNFPLQNYYTKRDVEKIINEIKTAINFKRNF